MTGSYTLTCHTQCFSDKSNSYQAIITINYFPSPKACNRSQKSKVLQVRKIYYMPEDNHFGY